MIDTLLADLRYAVRTFRKSPGFSAAAILTLALAVGSNTAVFSVVNGVLLRPLPFAEQDRLFMLAEQSRQGAFRPPSYPTFLDWRAQSSAFADLAYVRGGGQRLAGPEGVQSLVVSAVSTGFFASLGERPLLGRLFTPDEERAGAHVAVLSYGLWQGRFGGDPHILGKTLSLTAGVFSVVGVLPHDVAYPPWGSEQLYVPIATVAATDRALTQRGFHADCRIIGRLKSGVTAEQAKTGLDGVAQREAAAYPEFNADWTSVALIPLRDEILFNTTPQLLVLVVAVGLVLMIGCVNVANLTLARAGARSRELAIRSALGAGRGRVVRQLLTESLLLASLGGALGVMTAHWAVALLKRAAPAVLPRLETVGVDGWVLAFGLGVTIITAVATGLLPALRAARPDLTDSLKQGTAGAGTGRGRQRLRAGLVISEIALAVILVVGAGLLIRSLWRLRAVNPGFDPQGLVTFYISPPPLRAQDPARLAALYTQVEDAARALPGVTSVALTNFTPLSGGGLPSPVEIPGRAPDPERDPRVWFMTASPGYFRTMRIPVRAGREFTEADLGAGTGVLVNEAFVRAFWPGQEIDPLGRPLTLHKAVQGRPDFGEAMPGTVVGVVGDVHHFGLATPAEPQVYVPELGGADRCCADCIPCDTEQDSPPGRSRHSDDVEWRPSGGSNARCHCGSRVTAARHLAVGRLCRFRVDSRRHRHLRTPGVLRRAAAARARDPARARSEPRGRRVAGRGRWDSAGGNGDRGRSLARPGSHSSARGAPVRGGRERSHDLRGRRGTARARFAGCELSPRAPGGAGRSDGGVAI